MEDANTLNDDDRVVLYVVLSSGTHVATMVDRSFASKTIRDWWTLREILHGNEDVIKLNEETFPERDNLTYAKKQIETGTLILNSGSEKKSYAYWAVPWSEIRAMYIREMDVEGEEWKRGY